ncbi:MAG: sensor histidine kinase [Oryzihumus sp.]
MGRDTEQERNALGARRQALGWLLALGGPPLVASGFDLLARPGAPPSTPALALVALTVLCALVGGRWPAVVGAVLSGLLLNYLFLPPMHTFAVADRGDVVTLGLFVLVAVAVATVVDDAARRSVLARRARRDADALAELNRALLRAGHGVEALLALACEMFGASSAALLRQDPGDPSVVASYGGGVGGNDAVEEVATVSPTLRLVLRGRRVPAHDRPLLDAFATHLAVVLDRQELAERAAEARRLEEGNALRTALLAAVSHDLRTPLAGIKAAVSTLRTGDVELTDADRDELLAATEESVDRLGAIIANLLDLSRLQTGGVNLVLDDVGVEDVVARALRGLPDDGTLEVALPDDLPEVRVDAGLLERVVANLVDNAVRHTPPGTPVTVGADAGDGRVRLWVADRGPGVPDSSREELFAPFQRLGDTPAGEGVGLGLAVARGLTEAMGGTLAAEDTPGGGLTMVVDLPGNAPVILPAPPETLVPS